MLNNLLSNAFKFTPEGGTVSLSVRQLDGGDYAKYQFVVSDTGIGMSPEFLERIFEPYARELRFSDRQAAGTGLGMSITKNLVAQMGGEIQVESAPGGAAPSRWSSPWRRRRSRRPEPRGRRGRAVPPWRGCACCWRRTTRSTWRSPPSCSPPRGSR